MGVAVARFMGPPKPRQHYHRWRWKLPGVERFWLTWTLTGSMAIDHARSLLHEGGCYGTSRHAWLAPHYHHHECDKNQHRNLNRECMTALAQLRNNASRIAACHQPLPPRTLPLLPVHKWAANAAGQPRTNHSYNRQRMPLLQLGR